MADLAAFTSLLDSTLSAPRLSGTKVQSLTSLSAELTAKNLDTDLITSFYRANNALPPAGQGRISSLYVFDAIARAARSGANKEKEKGKAREGRGMTGLITKMEGVADSWVGGMMDDASGAPWTEGRDKMRKVLDIWVKGATFPPATLERLRQKVSPSAPPSVRSPGYGGTGHAGPSTTPPGTPPKAASFGQNTFDANEGYAHMAPVGGLFSGQSGLGSNGGVAASSSTPVTSSGALPADILKLLGANGAQSGSGFSATQTQSPVPAPASTIDIASILAAVRPGGQAGQNASTSDGQAKTNTGAASPAPGAGPGAPLAATILGALNLDPQQIAALSSLTTQNGSGAVSPPNGHPMHNGQPPFAAAMPQNGFAQPAQNFPGGSNDPRLHGAPDPASSSQTGSLMGNAPGFGMGGPPFPPVPNMNNMGGVGGRPPNDNRDPRSGYTGPDSDRRWHNDRDRPGPHSPRNGDGGGRFDGPDRRDTGGWDRGRDSRGPPNERNGYGSGSWNGPRPRSRSPVGRNGFGQNGGRNGRGSRDFDRDSGWGGGRSGAGPVRQGQDQGPDRQQDDRWRNDRRNGPNDRQQGGQRDQGYGNRGQKSGQGVPPHPSPQRGGGRATSGRAPLPEGRDMQLDGGRPGAASESASIAGSVGQGTPATKDGSTPLPHNLNRTPQQIAAGLPPMSSSDTGDARPANDFAQSRNGTQPGQYLNDSPNSGPGERLETFNIATFNPMMPNCWSALGRAFKNTTGREPNQMELMGFLAGQGPVPLPGAGGGMGGGGYDQQSGQNGPNAGMGMGMNFGGPGGPGHMGAGNGMGMGQGMAGGLNMGMPMGNTGNMGGPGGPGQYGGGSMNQRQGQY